MFQIQTSSLALLLLQVCTILLASLGLGRLIRRLGQPAVIAEVLAGIVLGPSLLGWLWPGATEALFPAASLPPLKALSELGLVLFMFLVGLDMDWDHIRGRTRASLSIGISSMLLPFALGAWAGWLLHPGFAPMGVGRGGFALFLGAAMSVTAFPVLARILAEQGLTKSKVGAIALACAAFNDVAAWSLLALVVALAKSGTLGSALGTLALAVAFILGMVGLLRPLLRFFGERAAKKGGLSRSLTAVVLVLLCLSAALTEAIGIHALFGAFLFGAVLPKQTGMGAELHAKLETVAVVLLLPLFFAYSGLRTDLGSLDGAQAWAAVGFILILATLGKFGGSAVAGRLSGLSWREANAVGILMNTRGLMELIVLNIGLDIGVLSPTVFTMMVIMALVTTVATTPALRWAYPQSR